MATNRQERFSRRVPFYARARPRYPAGVIDYVVSEIGLAPSWQVADIGAGTGLLSGLFLENGNVVYAVEPNGPMRAAGEQYLGHWPGFRSIDGSAEATGLESGCVDVVVAGQAFHWFDATAARAEFVRVARPPAHCALIWNQRPLHEEMPATLQGIIDRFSNRSGQDHRKLTAENSAPIRRFFSPGVFNTATLANPQDMDFARLCDYAASMSHMPLPGEEKYVVMVGALREFFDEYEVEGKLRLAFETRVFCGALA